MVFFGTLMYLRLGTLESLGSFSWARVRVRYVIRYVIRLLIRYVIL